MGQIGVRKLFLLIAAEVAHGGRKEGLDFRFNMRSRSIWPGDIKITADFGDHRLRVGQEKLVTQVGANQTARGVFRIQHVTQPYQEAAEGINVVARMQGRSNVKGAAYGRDDVHLNIQSVKGLQPEWQKTA